jgi:hypothetical protein
MNNGLPGRHARPVPAVVAPAVGTPGRHARPVTPLLDRLNTLRASARR